MSTYLQYSGISAVFATLSDGDDEATVGMASILAGASATIEGGLGTDRLILDFAGLPGTTFALDALGQVPALYGTYTGFENYTIKFAGGVNAVTMGAGDDEVWSNGGVDTIDGGDGLNRWYGDYSATATDMTVTANGDTETASLSNGTTIANIGHGSIMAGSGNDTFTLTNSHFSVQGGAGVDTLIERFSGTNNSYSEGGSYSSIATDGNGFFGQFHDDGGYFNGIAKLDIVLGDEDKTVSLNIDRPMLSGASLKLDAGLGANTFRVYAPAVTDTTLVLAADGSITSSFGTLSHSCIFDLYLGGGINTITTGAGHDSISVVGSGSNTISTGQYGISGQISGLRGANDRLSFGSMDKVDITFNGSDNEFRVYGYGASQNPARMRLDGGLGNDTITIFGEAAGYSVVKNGTGGYVVVDIDPSDEIVPEFTVTNFEHLHIQGHTTDTVIDLPAYGAGVNASGSVGNDTITGTEYADTLSGLAGNDTLLGLGGNDLLNGGAGDDKIDGGDGLDTVTYADAAAAVRVNLSVSAAQNIGGPGLETITNVENVTGSAFADTLVGNAQANVPTGLNGNDRLDGGAGPDTLIGGLGNDTYTVDNSGDAVTELAGEGTDTVNAGDFLVI